MTVGTPGFVGERLKEAREARALSQVALSDFLGVTRQAVSMYESGAMTPAPAVARQLANILRVSPEFFRRPEPLGNELALEGPVFFRSVKKRPTAVQQRALRRQEWVVALFTYLVQHIEFPEPSLPSLHVTSDPKHLEDEQIERMASDLRSAWGLGEAPIGNVVWLLESHGVVLVRDEVGVREIDAFSSWRDGVPFIVLGTDKGSAVRSRFDAAHELGHLVLHRNVDATRVERRDEHKLLEQQAHRFASAFLMPKNGYSRSMFLPSLEEFEALKPKWGVSIQSQIERCAQLNMISDSTRKRLWAEVSKRGWRAREPMDDSIPPEEPVLLRQALEVAISEGQISQETLENQVPVGSTDIEMLAGLPAGFLSNHLTAHSLNLAVSKGETADSDNTSERGVVIPFDRRQGS